LKKRVAVVGSGISGLSIAYFLSKKYHVDVFDSADYIGGHSNTVDVAEENRMIPIDTGFIVFNHQTYPNLLKLFDVLDVPTKKSNMSFSVQNEQTGIEFCGSGLKGLFSQKKNFFSLEYIRFLLEINRFNKESIKILDNRKYKDYTLEKYMIEENFSKRMLDDYLVPMSSAVWSTPPDKMLEFPATSLVRFFYNHGFLGLNTQHQWYTVDGGSREYVKRIIKPYSKNVFLNSPVVSVIPNGKKVEITLKSKKTINYDKVILASHGDTSLKMLKKPSRLQKEILSEFHFQPNTATLHTWDGDMPKIKSNWSSWNYKFGISNENQSGQINKKLLSDKSNSDDLVPFTVYWMNRLQNVSQKKDYFVTINDPGRIPKSHLIQKINYEHPLFSTGSVQAQERFNDLNSESNIHFVGAYFRYGFHEDGIDSSVRLMELLEGESPWKNL
jgi:predicted NAD/FAD-binding protein